MDTGIKNFAAMRSPVQPELDVKRQALVDKLASNGNPGAVNPANAVSKTASVTGVQGNESLEEGEKTRLDHSDLDAMVTQINAALQNERRSIQFDVDKDSGRTVIKVIDAKSGEQIKQIPAEEVLRISRQLAEQLDQDDVTGMLVQGRV